jgi:hypothetical protein
MWVDRFGNSKGDRSDAAMVDAPWAVHLPKMVLWAAAEGVKAAAVVLVLQRCAGLVHVCQQNLAATFPAGYADIASNWWQI